MGRGSPLRRRNGRGIDDSLLLRLPVGRAAALEPDEFERLIYPELSFAVPSNPDQYLERLISSFPNEERALYQYFRDIRSVRRWDVLGFARSFMAPFLGLFIRPYLKFTGAKATQTTGAYLNRHFRSPLLRALLASQWGDFGLSPSQSAFAIHAQIAGH